MPEGYRVQLEVFEGPLDLLYHLVENDEIDIWDIPIARITEQYLAYLDVLHRLDIEVAGEFLVMAARLLHIKASMLLPDEGAPEDDEAEEDPRADLAARLMEYKLYKEAARQLGDKGEGRWALTPRPDVYAPRPRGNRYIDPVGGVSLKELAKAFRTVLTTRRPQREVPIPHVKVSVADRVVALRRLFSRKHRVTFSSLFSESASRPELIATFVALLELIRQGLLAANQEGVFGPIVIERRESQDQVTRSDEASERTG